MKIKTLLASMAVASLVVAQPVAAATRSADSLPERGLRVASPVTNANYQNDDDCDSDDDDCGSTAVILGVVLVVLLGIAAISGGGGGPDSP